MFYRRHLSPRGTGRILLPENRLSWLSLNNAKLSKILADNGYTAVFFAEQNSPPGAAVPGITEANYRHLCYKGICLFSVAVYNICVEAETFLTTIDYSNPSHKRILHKWFARSVSYIDYMNDLISRERPKAIVNVQGHILENAIVRELAIRNNIPCLAIENTANKGKLLWDDKTGLAGNNQNPGIRFYLRYRCFIRNKIAELYVKDYNKHFKSFKHMEHLSGRAHFIVSGKRPAIVFLAQVYTDASALFGLHPAFQTPESLISLLVDYAIDRGYDLIIKMHPKEFGKNDPVTKRSYNSLTWRKLNNDRALMDKIDKHDSIRVDHENKFDTTSLIDAADVVVTVSSQSGLEALARGKDTILCGRSFYENLGVTFNARNPEMLRSFLDAVFLRKITRLNYKRIYKFFYIYFEKFCVPKTEASLFKLLKKRIL